MTTTPSDAFIITLKQYDPVTRRQRVYGQRCGVFCVLRTQQGITISTYDNPYQPIVFDDGHILCFPSVETAKQFIPFIAFLMSRQRPTLFQRIQTLWQVRTDVRWGQRWHALDKESEAEA